jgi:hypothetical protein
MQDPGEPDVLAGKPFCKALDVGATLFAEGSIRVNILRHGVAVLNEIKPHPGALAQVTI